MHKQKVLREMALAMLYQSCILL